MNGIPINRDIFKWAGLALGILGLIVTAVALIATPQHRFTITSYIALGVGVIGVLGYVLLDIETIVATITGRTGQFAIVTTAMSAFFVAILVIAYIVVNALPIAPLDLTEDQLYTLSPQTLDLLASLDEEVHVVGFYTDRQVDLQNEAQAWLQQYTQRSNGMLTYEFIDPDRRPGRALQLGMTRASVLLFTQGERTAEATLADERNLTSALIQVQLGEPRRLYVLTGHSERDIDGFGTSDYSTAKAALESENFEVEPLNLIESGGVPDDATAIVIAGPTAQLSSQEVEALSEYLNTGGGVMLLIDPTISTGVMTSGVQGLAYSHDGERLATASADDTARVWDAETGEELLILSGHTSDVLGVDFSPDDSQIATASADGTVRLWDARTGEQLALLEGHRNVVWRVRFSPDGEHLASVGQDQTLILWDLSTYEPISAQSVQAPLFGLAYSPDGSTIATSGSDGSVTIWEGDTGKPTMQGILHTDMAFSVTFSPDGTTVYSVGMDGSLGVIDMTAATQSTIPLYPGLGIIDIAFLPDGQVALALADATVRLHSLGSGADERVFTGHEGLIWQIAVSPDGEHFATASQDGEVRIWSVDSPESILQISGHTGGDPLLRYLAEDWGIIVNDDIVVELETAEIPGFDEFSPVVFYRYSAESAITLPLLASEMPSFFIDARSLSEAIEVPPVVAVMPLVNTSPEDSWGETNFAAGSVLRDETDIPGPLTLAMSAENYENGSRVVVVGDADFASNAALTSESYGNIDLFLNAVNWLAQEEDLLDIRPRATAQRTFDPFDPITYTVVTILSWCLLPTLVVVAGFVVWLTRRLRS